ncbi:MAG: YitT family protein [Clostridiales bacterium]|jgi:uncharacterized membrane-anchored protein YitT (DUF2179 family)|nr:YitT family protein [Clostridiales bacterium]
MNEVADKKERFFNLAVIAAGSIILAISISVFYKPSELVTGGVSGLAIVIERVTDNLGFPVPIWFTNAALNAPLFIIGFKVLGTRALAKTAFATVLLTIALYLTDLIPPFVTNQTMLVSLFGGVCHGVGLGLVFSRSATTGGSDMCASLLQKTKLQHIGISKIMFAIDFVVIALGFFMFGLERGMYAIIAIFVSVKTIDVILEGLSFAKVAYIISEKAEDIAQLVMDKMARGVTGLSGKGMYSKAGRTVLLCVVSSKEIVKLKEFVRGADPAAFVIVGDVREVMGEGFANLS